MNKPPSRSECQSSRTIVFDIETIPQDEKKLLALAPEFEPDPRLKDPAKIKNNLAYQKRRFIERAALDWKTAQIVLIGVGDGKKFKSITGTESAIIGGIFKTIEESIVHGIFIGGHAIKGFDLPMLVNRARILKIKIPEVLLYFRSGRPIWSDQIFDTLEILSFGDRQRIEGNGVDAIAKVLGLPPKLGDGVNFPDLWKKNKKGAITYNQRDVELEIEIAKICGFKF